MAGTRQHNNGNNVMREKKKESTPCRKKKKLIEEKMDQINEKKTCEIGNRERKLKKNKRKRIIF